MTYRARYPGSASALLDALADDPFYSALADAASGDPEVSRDRMHRYLDYSLVEAARFGVVCFPADRRQGAAAWSRPVHDSLARQRSREKKEFIERNMGSDCLAVYEAITEHMRSKTAKWVPEDCWYLSIVGVSPESQGRGVGRRLLERILQRADAAGANAYLETFTPRNKTLYQRLGFVDTATIDEPVTGTSYSVMVR